MERPLQIAFKNVESSASMEALIRDRAKRLQRFYPNITGARVVVEIPHRSPEGAKPPLAIAVEVDIPGRGPVVAKGEEERRQVNGDHSPIVNRVFEAAERQLEQISAIRKGEVKVHGAAGDTGVVVRIFPDQNYGFVEVKDSPDLYFSREVCGNGSFENIKIGSLVHVTRAVSEGPMGPQASSVKLLGGSSPS
ncbi:HPF/RaiA family ribosome-associated protein [Hyphomicrobium sp. 1Nfss2.1]|uniref:HPF/RaiA family ribosome-associated protein n=1 Tax=Hyphomicrobium sp. 1Nfss2.1 TaxID=3413936 RepID=UPI003C7E20EF